MLVLLERSMQSAACQQAGLLCSILRRVERYPDRWMTTPASSSQLEYLILEASLVYILGAPQRRGQQEHNMSSFPVLIL